MTSFQDVRAAGEGMPVEALLRWLIQQAFPGRTVVTASLRARSVVVLKLVAEIDPATPVVFCQPSALFPESLAYRADLVRRLGLSDVSVGTGREAAVLPGDADHVERMWGEDPIGGGRVHEIVHLNETLADFDCWISAVYHLPNPIEGRNLVDVEGRLIRVDPLIHWPDERVRAFMRRHRLPYHPRAATPPRARVEGEPVISYGY